MHGNACFLILQFEENGKYYCAEVVNIMLPYDKFVQYSNGVSNNVSPEN
jgi:hypothetical protein